MRVRCMKNHGTELIKDKDYEVVAQTEYTYNIVNEKGITNLYWQSNFTPIKEEVMKIKEWKELDGICLGDRKIKTTQYALNLIYVGELGLEDIIFYYDEFSKETIIKFLALLGIEVEFEKEPTITQNDYNWLVAMDFSGDMKLRKSIEGGNIWRGHIEYLETRHLLKQIEISKGYLVSDLLKYRVEG